GEVTERTGLDLQQAEAGAVRVEVRVDQPGNDRTAAAVDDPVARLRAPADLDDRARCDPDAAFPQLGRTAVEDPRVGEGCDLRGHSCLTSDSARHRAPGNPENWTRSRLILPWPVAGSFTPVFSRS